MENGNCIEEFKMNSPKVFIIILNWNSWKDTIECLKSLFKITYDNYEVIVVDNDSKDDSISKIVEYLESIGYEFSHEFNSKRNQIKNIYKSIDVNLNSASLRKITLIVNDNNYGFAQGNNIGIKYINKNTNYILLLNNDTIVDPKFLNELINVANNRHDIGFVGPKIYYYDFNGSKNVINFVGGFLNMRKGQAIHNGINQLDKGQFDKLNEVDYVQGSCLLFKPEIIKMIGFMNPFYFMYWEEADWCYRGIKKGYKSIIAPKAKIWHKISTSSGGSLSPLSIYYLTRNRFIFMKLNASKTELLLFILYFFIIDFWTNFFGLLKYRNALIEFFKGLKDGIIYFLSV